jgi:processive 1,2-diacylglycerol beta-glucosyltransferase
MNRVSILTASFGEGHNTAARNVREALLETGGDKVAVEICDLYQRTNPRYNRTIQIAYSVAINRYPRAWAAIFSVLGMRGVLEAILPALGSLREAMRTHFLEFRPDILVSTYPIYSFLVREIRRKSPFLRAPLVTVVTDSTVINPAWYRCSSDAFCVPDEPTAETLRQGGVDPARIHVFGFPVSLRFSDIRPLPIEAGGPPWKVLFYPSTRRGHTIKCIERLLAIPDVEITVLTGKNTNVHEALERAGYANRPRVTLVGWTDRMPELLAAHHWFLGKAGGAIVQECVAAQVPIIVSHVVPGQEEGNLELVRRLGVGTQAEESPAGLAAALQLGLKNNAALWKTWKANLAAASRPDGARSIARFLREFSTSA